MGGAGGVGRGRWCVWEMVVKLEILLHLNVT